VPTKTWRIDSTTIELVDRGPRASRTLRAGDFVMEVPRRTIGAWPIPVPGRNVRLEVRRNLNAVRFFVFSDEHPVPRDSSTHRDAAAGTTCAAHQSAAVCRCARCDAASCRACSPDGHHCGTCAWALHDEEAARIRRVRARAFYGSLAVFAAILAIGLLVRSKHAYVLGAGGLFLTGYLAIGGWFAERRERRAGWGAATDPRFAAQPEARAKTRSR
jgi:hypothetical protein